MKPETYINLRAEETNLSVLLNHYVYLALEVKSNLDSSFKDLPKDEQALKQNEWRINAIQEIPEDVGADSLLVMVRKAERELTQRFTG